MNINHLLIFCVVLGGWLLLAKKLRKDVNEFGDDWLGTLKYYGLTLFIFSFLGGFLFFFDNSSVSGDGQINAFTGQDSSKNYRLSAEMTVNPGQDMFQYFKTAQYKITSVTWPDGTKNDAHCVVHTDSRDECEIGGQTYRIEVAWFQSNEVDTNN